MRTAAVFLCVFLLVSASNARENDEEPLAPQPHVPEALPEPTFNPQDRLLDLSADTLAAGEWEIGLFWGRVARGITPNLQLSTHALGWPLGALNVFAKWRFFNHENLRASVEGGVVWVASAMLLGNPGESRPLLLFVPVEFRATVPLADNLDLHLGGIGRWSSLDMEGAGLGAATLRLDLSVARSDSMGAWIASARAPLVTRASLNTDELLGRTNVAGAIALDELPSWGLLIARDQVFGNHWHARLGLGYRNTYGILMYESLGHVLVNLDVYWRRPPS